MDCCEACFRCSTRFDEQRSTAQQQAFVTQALTDTDRRVAEGQSRGARFLLARLLWHDVLAGWHLTWSRRRACDPALQQAIEAVFDTRRRHLRPRQKLGTDMREIWMMQPRFERQAEVTPRAR